MSCTNLVSSFSTKVIAAEGEQKASRALKEASEVIAESSSALQLRYLQVCIPLSYVGKYVYTSLIENVEEKVVVLSWQNTRHFFHLFCVMKKRPAVTV